MSEDERRAYRITGRVQGVGFRWWTRKTAQGMDLRGTVRNAEDGSVQVHVAGPAEALRSFEERLREGPGPARVDRVQAIVWSIGEPPPGFEITR